MVLRAGFHGTVGQPSAQVIDGSLKFDNSKTTNLSRTPGSEGNRKTWTWSGWFNRQNVGANDNIFKVAGSSNKATQFTIMIHNGNYVSIDYGGAFYLKTNRLLRDTSGWYNFVVTVDTTLGTADNRIRLYINGVEETSFATRNNPNQDEDLGVNRTSAHTISTGDSNGFDGLLSNFYLIDGQALGPGYFGFTDPLTNTWKPRKRAKQGAPTVNDGTVWSSSVAAGSVFRSGYPAVDAFNGVSKTSTNDCAAPNNVQDAFVEFTFGGGVHFTTLELQCDDNNSGTVVANGVDITSQLPTGSLTNTTITGVSSPLTSLRLTKTTSDTSTVYLGSVTIDGIMLTDSTTTTVGFGTNGFYLPMDGNSPIGQDKSGRGNNWTPVNFGGSNSLEEATGAKPILNTTQGGTQATVGVFGSKQNVGYAVTYYDDGGGNKYYIDGVKQATLTGLIRGATYTFNTVALGSTHPFRLSATSAHGTEYTNGVAAITGAATTITIPYDAPESLYYYCTAHSGMGSSITGITTNEKLADQYASNCVLALPFVGSANDVSASIACTQTNYSITSNGNAAASSDKSNFYNGSFEFDGNGDSLTFTTSSALSLSGDFTIEFWINNDTITTDTQYPSPITMPTDGNGISQVYTQADNDYYGLYKGNDVVTTGNNSALTNVWQHVAFTRSGSTCYAFLNGDLKNTATNQSETFGGTSGTYRIGSYNGSGGDVDAYMQDLRIYNGVAKYTSNFVPAATSRDILPDTPSGVSGGSKLTKITDGSVSFDGTGDKLILDIGSGGLGSGDFTIEFFSYANTTAGSRGMFQLSPTSGGLQGAGTALAVYHETGQSSYRMYVNDNASGNSTSNINSNRWNHFALVRSGSTQKLYINGIEEISASSSIDYTTARYLCIGGYYSTSYLWDGFISNFRIVKGTALYTSNFTPPTEPLTNVTNTKLLCCQSNTSAGAAAVSPQISGLNSGTVWSDYLTTTQGANPRDFYTGNNYPPSNLFDGDTSTIVYGGWTDDADDDSDLIFSPPGGVAVSSKLEVYVGYYSKIKVNGSDYNTGGQSTAQAWVTVSDGSNFTGTLTELILENTSNANVVRAAAIRIDDSTILLDPVLQQGNAAATTFNPFDTDINTVRGQETGYPTWNPLVASTSSFSDGNLKITTQASGYVNDLVTMRTPAGTGKWYWEFVQTARTGTDYTLVGMLPEDNTYQQGNSDIPQNCGGIGLYIGNNGVAYVASGAATAGTTSATFDVGDVLGWAFDAENGTVECYKNGVPQGTQFTNVRTDTGWTFCVTDYDNTTVSTFEINFGQKPFKFPPPDGYQPLNTANVRPETVVPRSDQFVGLTTYTGNGGTQSINVGLKPDFIWLKCRNEALYNILIDSVRGNTKELYSNDTTAEQTTSNTVTSINQDGFSLGDRQNTNKNTNTYVGWCWKAGGSKGTFNIDDVSYASAAAAGLDGGLTVTGASVGTKQGFSIIKATGSNSQNSFKHGLGKVPKFVIAKDMDNSRAWYIYHGSLGANYRGSFDGAQFTSDSEYFGSGMTDTLVTLKSGGSGGNNYDGANMIYYVWADVPGLQKFGTYSGNSNADGPFIELGFRPALFVMKQTDSTGYWMVYDSARDPINNGSPYYLFWNDASAHGTGYDLDFLSNGVKLRTDNANFNTTSYVYAAWAEAPTIDLYGGGANAR